jgi:hypothetical protein
LLTQLPPDDLEHHEELHVLELGELLLGYELILEELFQKFNRVLKETFITLFLGFYRLDHVAYEICVEVFTHQP